MSASAKSSTQEFYKTFLISLLFIFSACSSENNVNRTPSVVGDIIDTASWYTLPLDSRIDITESNSSVSGINSTLADIDIYIPVPNSSECLPWNDFTAPIRPCTLEDVDHDIYGDDAYEPTLNTTLSTGSFTAAGEFKIRGNYTRTLSKKSYAFKLDSDTNLLNYQKKYQFNKHLSDPSRIKNKLAFDLFRTIPNLTSLKTQFVHLTIRDDINGTVDYGLFTHVEAMGEEYLKNRGWNPDDNLYNVNNFQFDEWAMENLTVTSDGKPTNKENFEQFLEVKAGKDHRMLQEMLQAVNSNEDIDQVVTTYFNRDNYITWIAINLLLCNQDVSYHNFYLYNPRYSKTFYFLPWDYDGAWSSVKYLGKAEYGIAVLMEVPLHRKFLSIQKNREDVYAMAENLRANYLTAQRMQALIDSYETSVMQAEPTISSWKDNAQNLLTSIDVNIDLYKSIIGHPMPFYEKVSYQDGILKVTWEESVDFEGDPIVYDLKVGTNYDLNTTIISQEGLNDLNYTQSIVLDPGTYYVKVTSRELGDPTHYQEAFNRIRVENDSKTVYGMVTFDVQ